jgi:hypothetical protein
MTKPVTESVLAAAALALAVIITRVGPAQRAPIGAAAHSPAPASERSGDALALVPRSDLAGAGAVPQDDGSDSDDGGESDDDGDVEDADGD